jgi:peroxiredoxin
VNLTWILIAAAVVIAGALLVFREKIRGRAVPDILQPGNPLPEFAAVDEDGKPLYSNNLRGRPSVILFVRGSWCPFCSKQVQNLTDFYKAINESGAHLILVTPKPLDTTRRVADFFDVKFEFWLDESLAIGKKLGLVLEAGVPDDYDNEYGHDTLWPTSLIVDGDGIIRHTELSRFIADRPDPEKLLAIVNNL